MNFIKVLCAKKMLFIHTHVSCHVISSLYHVSSCLCCSLHCYSTSKQRSKSLWLHSKVTGCNPLSHYPRFAILLKTFIVSLEMLMRYNNSCNDCNTVHTVWELHSMFWGSVYSYFDKGCQKKCTRQSRKVLWVVLRSLFFKEIWKNGTRGCGRMFARAKGKQGTVYWSYPILPFGIVACTFLPTTFLEIAVYRENLSRVEGSHSKPSQL